jgi:hypothetical protein
VTELAPPRPPILSAWLDGRPPRPDAEQPLTLSSAPRLVELLRPEQHAAAAVGLLILERLAAHGGTRLPTYVLRELRQALTEPLNSRDVMNLEVEAYDTMSWLAALEAAPEASPRQAPAAAHADVVEYDPSMPVLDLLRRAILEEFDVEMQYYTQSRGELTRRRVSPRVLQGETYLHAYCHTRQTERVFRLSRIAELRPVDGRPTSVPHPRKGQGQLPL